MYEKKFWEIYNKHEVFGSALEVVLQEFGYSMDDVNNHKLTENEYQMVLRFFSKILFKKSDIMS